MIDTCCISQSPSCDHRSISEQILIQRSVTLKKRGHASQEDSRICRWTVSTDRISTTGIHVGGMYSHTGAIASSAPTNKTSTKKARDKNINFRRFEDSADKLPTTKRQGSLGSSFGGVIFRPQGLPYNRRSESLESQRCQQDKPYIHDTLGRVFLVHDGCFHCRKTHSLMANSCIDRECACDIGLHKRATRHTGSNCCNIGEGIDDQQGVVSAHLLGCNCADFKVRSRCAFVRGRDTCKSVYEYYKDVHWGIKLCGGAEDSTREDQVWAIREAVCVSRFIMGDDDCLKEGQHNGTISTHCESTESGNIGGRSSESDNLVQNSTESSRQVKNLTASTGSPDNYPEVCHHLNGYTDTDTDGQRERHVDSTIHSENLERCLDSGLHSENLDKFLDSARNSMDSTASDNVFFSSQSIMNSISDVTSISSMSSCQSTARDTITSRKRFELRHGNHPDSEGSDYITPSQRKEKELKELRKERLQLLREQQEKDVQMAALRACIETLKAQVEEEKAQEMAELVEKLKVSERQRFQEMEALCKAQEELAKMDAKYTDLKQKLSEKEDKFQEYLFDMYKKGQLAAMFERDQELEMLATSNKGHVSVRELTRKLSRTELELAKWQGLKREESYTITERPETQAEATLSFLKDSFFHFLTSKSDSHDHLRAMITIFHYSDVQMAKIRKGLEDFKRLDRKRLSLK